MPTLIVLPLKVSVPALKTFTVTPALMPLPLEASNVAPEATSSVAPESGCMSAAELSVPMNSKVPPLLMNSGLPVPSLVTCPPVSRMARAPAETVPPSAVPPERMTRVNPLLI